MVKAKETNFYEEEAISVFKSSLISLLEAKGEHDETRIGN